MTYEIDEDQVDERVLGIVEDLHSDLATEHGRDNVLVTVEIGDGVGSEYPGEWDDEPASDSVRVDRIASGTIAERYALDPDTGELSFVSTKDFRPDRGALDHWTILHPEFGRPLAMDGPADEVAQFVQEQLDELPEEDQ